MNAQTGQPNHGHPPHLAHHFHTPGQQFQSAVFGMWLFLATEILLFGGLFCAYAVYRGNHPEVFVHAHHYLDRNLGAINTIILLISSFTMAAAVWAVQHGRQRMLVGMLVATLVCAGGFIGIKAVEYQHKWQHGLLWGKYYQPQQHDSPATTPAEEVPASAEPAAEVPAAAPAPTDDGPHETFRAPSPGPTGLVPPGPTTPEEHVQEAQNVRMFFSVYFGMTGLHGLHVIAGMIAIAWVLVGALQGRFSPAYFTPVPMVGLYWHVVDLIWIYLFPLFYLIH
jgi:cytochrome c oxidase subunit 3